MSGLKSISYDDEKTRTYKSPYAKAKHCLLSALRKLESLLTRKRSSSNTKSQEDLKEMKSKVVDVINEIDSKIAEDKKDNNFTETIKKQNNSLDETVAVCRRSRLKNTKRKSLTKRRRRNECVNSPKDTYITLLENLGARAGHHAIHRGTTRTRDSYMRLCHSDDIHDRNLREPREALFAMDHGADLLNEERSSNTKEGNKLYLSSIYSQPDDRKEQTEVIEQCLEIANKESDESKHSTQAEGENRGQVGPIPPSINDEMNKEIQTIQECQEEEEEEVEYGEFFKFIQRYTKLDHSVVEPSANNERECNDNKMSICFDNQMEEVEEFFYPAEEVTERQIIDQNTAPLLEALIKAIDATTNMNTETNANCPQAVDMNNNFIQNSQCCNSNYLEPMEICEEEVVYEEQVPTEAACADTPVDPNLSHWTLGRNYKQYGDKVDYTYFTEEFYDKNRVFFEDQTHNQNLTVVYDEKNKITSYTVQLQTLDVKDNHNENEYDASELRVIDLLTQLSNYDKRQLDWNNPEEIQKIKYCNFQLPPLDLSTNYLKCAKCDTTPDYDRIVTVCQSAKFGDFRGLEELEVPDQEPNNQKPKDKARKNTDDDKELAKRSKKTPPKRKPKPAPNARKPSKNSGEAHEDSSPKKPRKKPAKRKNSIPIPLNDFNRICRQLEKEQKQEMVANNLLNLPRVMRSAARSPSFTKTFNAGAVKRRTDEEIIAELTDTQEEITLPVTQVRRGSTASVVQSRVQPRRLSEESTIIVLPAVDQSTVQPRQLSAESTIILLPAVDQSTIQSAQSSESSNGSVMQSVDVSTVQISDVAKCSSSPSAQLAKDPKDSNHHIESKEVTTSVSTDTTCNYLLPPLNPRQEFLPPATHPPINSSTNTDVEQSTLSGQSNTPHSTLDKSGVEAPVCNSKDRRVGRSKPKKKTKNKRGECEKCGKVLTTTRGLKYHLEKVHTPEKDAIVKPYVCPFKSCTKKYKQKNGLRYHLNRNHTETEGKVEGVDNVVCK